MHWISEKINQIPTNLEIKTFWPYRSKTFIFMHILSLKIFLLVPRSVRGNDKFLGQRNEKLILLVNFGNTLSLIEAAPNMNNTELV